MSCDLYEVPRVVKFIETESRIVVPGTGGGWGLRKRGWGLSV